MADRIKIKEAIVVEGRDDTINLKRAVDCFTLETHGFGIKRETLSEIEKAYETIGIIIFTDPDHSGEVIRRRLGETFPKAKHAFLSREDALKKGDIGVENAEPGAIIEALKKCRAVTTEDRGEITEDDLYKLGLAGGSDSKKLRELTGKYLGTGYANAGGFLKKLNGFQIRKEELYEAVRAINDQRDKR